MVDPDLLEILVCPESRTPVRLADKELLDMVNRRITEGRLRTRGGETVTEPLAAALVREDGALLYPIRDDIPVMLIEEAIPLEPLP
jgi:uncharacterized protein YbaR (Trm112 family)